MKRTIIFSNVLSGQSIAKTNNLPPRVRASDAAAWCAGDIVVVPTVRMASRVFGVCERLISIRLAARGPIPEPSPVTAMSSALRSLSSEERQVFVHDNLGLLWREIENVTTPSTH